MSNQEIKDRRPIRELIQTENAPNAVGTYSQAVSAGGFLYTSGQVGINPSSGEIESKDVKLQCLQVLKNILEYTLIYFVQIKKNEERTKKNC